MTADLLQIVIADTDRLRASLTWYAEETDTPAPGTVELADLLDAAREKLGGGT
ncbi:MAG TPA: hypothetical protein PLY54_05875 [Ottowia sp.]|jgi:hypothetical protein|nr:hypothetical protein [Ottowia sp.]